MARESPRRAVSACALAAALAAVCPRPGQAFLWWRDGVKSAWTSQSASADIDPARWSQAETTYETDLDFQAKNDGQNLYLFVSADGEDGKALLLGSFRQDLTLWLFKPDGKTRDWGVRAGFSGLDLPAPGSWKPAPGQDLSPATPDLSVVQFHGAALSTAPLFGDVFVQSALSGKEPVLTVTIPLSHLAISDGKVLADFTSSPVSDQVKAVVSDWDAHAKPRARSGGNGGPFGDDGSSPSAGGGRRGGRHGGGGGRQPDTSAPQTSLPDALDLRLAVRLASSEASAQ